MSPCVVSIIISKHLPKVKKNALSPLGPFKFLVPKKESPPVKEKDASVGEKYSKERPAPHLGTSEGHVQIGGGSGKKIATAAGAVAGGYAGNKTQERMQANDTYTTTERRCHTEHETKTEVTGYDVRYRLRGEEHSVRMDHRPGERIPVVDGQLVLNPEPPNP